MAILGDASLAEPPFAPPFLADGDTLISQTANILFYLGPRHGLTAESERGRLFVNQLQLTLADVVAEAHDVHHPVGVGLYYRDQKPEAARRAGEFRNARIGKYLGYFERVLANNPSGSGWLVDAALTYADLSLFQVLEGLRYAFPRSMAIGEAQWPRITTLGGRIAERPRIAAYLSSPRRIAFNEDGIFRHYPELDAPA